MSTSLRYRVLARSVDLVNLGEVPDFEAVTVELRWNDVGSCHLTAPVGSRADTLLSKNGGLIVTRESTDAGDHPVVVFSGPVSDYRRTREAIEVTAKSDELLLAERVAPPDPHGPPYTTEYDLREGTASTVLLDYVDVNCGPSALARRRDPHLVLGPDQGVGSYVYGQARWVLLLALLQELALRGGGLRFQLRQTDTTIAQLAFTVSETTDRSDSVVISRGRGTLGEFARTISRPVGTYAFVLGQGQGINRQVEEGGDGLLASTYGRYIEVVADRRDTNDPLILAQARAALLAENGEAEVVEYLPMDTDATRFGVDYDVGDLVTVVHDDGTELVQVVRGATITLDGAGVMVQPIVSTPGDPMDDLASRQLRATKRRVDRLEQNIDAIASVIAVQWNVGDYRMTSRDLSAPGWLLCQGQAVSRVTYADLFDVIGTTYGAGDGTTTFNLPDLQDRFPIGKSGTRALGSTGGAATVDSGHTHAAGMLAGPSHTHAAGALAGPAHAHAAGMLAGPSHSHSEGGHVHGVSLLTVPNHSHAAGMLAGPSHSHSTPNHQHAAGTLAGPSHTHSAASLGVGGSTGVVAEAGSGAATTLDTTVNLSHGGTDKVARDQHTHGSGLLDVTGSTDAGGTGSVTGSTATDGSGTSGSGGTGSVTGATATDGGTAVGGGQTDSGAGAATGSAGTGSVTGSTAVDGTQAVTGSTASDGTQAVTGSTGSGGSAALAIVPPYVVVNYEIYAGV